MYNNFLRGGHPYGGNGAFPDNPTTADYERDVIPKEHAIPLAIILVGVLFSLHGLCLILLACSKWENKLATWRAAFRYCLWCSAFYLGVNVIVAYNLYSYYYQGIEYHVCRYPFDCDEAANDTIATSNYYYAVPRDTDPYCPTIDHMISYYLKENDIEEKECPYTEYGCCEFSVSCFFYSEYDYLYSDLVSNWEEDMSGGIIYDQRKLDTVGSNCAIYNDKDSIADLIEAYLEKPDIRGEEHILIYLFIYLFIYLCMISCIACTTKKKESYSKMSGSV